MEVTRDKDKVENFLALLLPIDQMYENVRTVLNKISWNVYIFTCYFNVSAYVVGDIGNSLDSVKYGEGSVEKTMMRPFNTNMSILKIKVFQHIKGKSW